jgi:hypothetical protein
MEPLPATGILAPNEKRFPWGPIQKIHDFGPYKIVEYLNDKSNYAGKRASEGHGEVRFHAYINDEDTCCSFYRIDSAIVGAINYARCGPNSQAAAYFDLMTLGVIPE